jgi:hypothetical protein
MLEQFLDKLAGLNIEVFPVPLGTFDNPNDNAKFLPDEEGGGLIAILEEYFNDEEYLVELIAHECVHYLQLEKSILIGRNPLEFAPSLTEEQVISIINIVQDSYPEYAIDEETWDQVDIWSHEIPAWSLQFFPKKVLELL